MHLFNINRRQFLIQVGPVEVVALCDVDKNMLAAAAKLVSQR